MGRSGGSVPDSEAGRADEDDSETGSEPDNPTVRSDGTAEQQLRDSRTGIVDN